MTFIATIPEDDAEGATAHWYAADRERLGYLPNYTKVFGQRPAVYAAWKQLGGAIGGAMGPRRYELATLAAAARCFFSTVLEAPASSPTRPTRPSTLTCARP